jgi:hypothetical protein
MSEISKMKTTEPAVIQTDQEKTEGDWKVVPADGLQEVPEELQKLNKDSVYHVSTHGSS